MTSTMQRTYDAGDRIGQIIHGAEPRFDPSSAQNLGRLVASCLFAPEGQILTGEDLEPIRPREWCLTWRQAAEHHPMGGPTSFGERERAFDNEPDAIKAAQALLDVERTLGDVRAVHLAVRCSALPATSWEEVGL